MNIAISIIRLFWSFVNVKKLILCYNKENMEQAETNGYLILTAAAFSNPKVKDFIKEKVSSLDKKRVAIIPTASEGKGNNKYSILAKDIYVEMGAEKVFFVDIETEINFDFKNTDVIHLCGGNSFKLLHFARLRNLDSIIKDLISRGGICIGVSAGSLILGPSIKIASEVRPDINEINETNFKGLNLTNTIIFPHYEEEVEDDILNFETENRVQVTRLRNDQAIVIQGTESFTIQ